MQETSSIRGTYLPYKLASAINTDMYSQEIEEIMEAIGIECYLTTDESRVSHFGVSLEDIMDLSMCLGVPVSGSDLIYIVASRLRNLIVS